jgi:hypothetical protein
VTDIDKQEAIVVRYLLGLSPQEEREQVEERFLSDSAYFDNMLALEDSLVDDFVSGRMPLEQRDAFSKSFVFRHDDVQFAAALYQSASKKNPERQEAFGERIGPGSRIAPFARIHYASLVIGLAALVLLIACGILFLINRSLRNELIQSDARMAELREAADEQVERELRRRESSERELEAERNRRMQAERELDRQAPFSSQEPDSRPIVLRPQLASRGGAGSFTEIRLREYGGYVPFNISTRLYSGFESFDVSFRRDGLPVVERSALGPAAPGSLRFKLPAGDLSPGDYVLVLTGRRKEGAAEEELERYPLRIIR